MPFKSKNDYRTRNSFSHSLTHSCLGRLIIFAAIMAVVLVIAHFYVPDKQTMTYETEDAIRQCIIDNDSIKADDIDAMINNIGYIFSEADTTGFKDVWELFQENNELKYYEHFFYSTMHVCTNLSPEGKRISIGFLGMTIPMVFYDDLLLNVDIMHGGFDEKIIKTEEGDKDIDFGDNPGIREYQYKGDKSNKTSNELEVIQELLRE